VGLESRGCKREPRKVLDVGVGNAEGERMGEMLKRRGEREADCGLRLAGGHHLPMPAPPPAGALDRTIKR
jgi:hypothetical protein